MKLRVVNRPILEFKGEVKIVPVVYSDEEFYETDGYSVYEQAFAIAQASGIRISRNKDLAFAAIDEEGQVVGAVWKDFSIDHEMSDDYGKDVFCYDFDIAVDREARAKGLTSARIGVQLIDTALEDFRNEEAEHGAAYIKTWVINPKLAKWLEYNRGFEPSAMSRDGSGIMTYNESSEYDDLEDVDEFADNNEFVRCDNCDATYTPAISQCECGHKFCDRCLPGGDYFFYGQTAEAQKYRKGFRFSDGHELIHCPFCPNSDLLDRPDTSTPWSRMYESSEYDDLEDVDEFGGGCMHPGGCDYPGNWECNKCGQEFCDDHILAVAHQPVQDLCWECLRNMGYDPEVLAVNMATTDEYGQNWL